MQLYQQPEEDQQIVLSTAPAADTSVLQARQTEEEDVVATSKSVTDLLATAEQQNAQGKWAVVFGMIVGALVALIAAFPHSPIAIFSYVPTVFLFVFIAGTLALRYHRTTQALAQVDDVRMVGPLIDRVHSGDRAGPMRRIVRQALIRLLPRLKASDASLLTPSQKGRLAHHLGHLSLFRRDKDFQIVILRAFEQVGDAQAIPVVEGIVQRRPRWAAQEQVHTAAVECLPFLLQRAQEENVRNTLLRATSRSKESGGQLLRPADGSTEIGVHDLLRADPSSEPTPQQSDDGY